MDSIDIGVGLYLTLGTDADPVAAFTSYVDIDQNIKTNRWGVCSGAGSNVAAWGVLRAGGDIEFLDITSVVAFKDGYHGAGFTGVLHELDHADGEYTMGATLIGEGKLYDSGAIDTRPDYVITDTVMTATYSLIGDCRNFRNITLNEKVDADGASLECQLLTQATAEIQNCIVKANALTNVACLQDPTFNTTTDLHDTTFVQVGVGHAIEALADGTWTGIKFSGFGGTPGDNLTPASGAADAAVFNDTGGLVTITIVGGGDIPSVRNGSGATTAFVTGVITLQVTVLDKTDDTPLTTAHVQLLKDSDKSVLLSGAVNGSGVLSDTISYDTDTDVVGWAREHDIIGTDYTQQDFSGEYTVNGFAIIIRLVPAE
jgi:hypothetical protein